MATKPVTLIPWQYSFMNSSDGSFTSWRSYSSQRVSLDTKRGCAFRFFIDREATLSNIRVNYSISSQFVYGDIKIHATSRSVIYKDDGSLIRSYDGSGTVTGSGSYSGTIDFDGSNYLYIIITAYGGYDDVSIDSLSVSATLEADIPALTITGISPNPAIASKNVTFSFGNRLGHDLTLELTSGGITIATYHYIDEDEFTVTAESEWLSSKAETEITAKATDSTDELFPREATAKFKIKADPIGVELTATPTYSGPNSNITVTFKNRKGHSIYLTVQGAEKGSSNKKTLVSRNNITSSIENEKYSIIAADSWFTSINGNEMTVYLKFEDTVETREETPSFVLKAGDGTKPTIGDIELSSYIYPQSDADILEEAGYTGFVVGYSYIDIKVRCKPVADTSMSTVTATFNSTDISLSYKSPDPLDSEWLIYTGTTTKKITSKSDSTIKITAVDSRERSGNKDAYIYANEITQLPNLNLQSGTATAGENLIINPSGYIKNYNVSVKTKGIEVASASAQNVPYTLATDYVTFFILTGQANSIYVNLQVEITDALGRSITNSSFTLKAPNPQIDSFSYTHIPDDRMPNDESKHPNQTDVVAGYSKIKLTANVVFYYTKDSVIAKDSAGNSYTLFEETSGHYVSEEILVPLGYSSLYFTLTAKDKGKISNPNRTGETTGERQAITIYRLNDITLRCTNSPVDADTNAILTASNYVGAYRYTARVGNNTITPDEDITAGTFTIKVDTEWFTDETGSNITVYVNITDALGRTAKSDATFTARLNQFTLTLSPIGNITIDGDVQISVNGSGSQDVTIVLTTPKNGQPYELASTTVTTASPATVRCLQTWFTDHTEFDNIYQLPITVTASYAGRSAKQDFKLVFPDLGLTLQKADSSGDTATEAKVGDSVIYNFANQKGESVNVHYYYSNILTPIRSLGPYSASSETIATPQLFDDANAKTVQTMNVRVVISDKRGRTAKVDNFTVKVRNSMKPRIIGFPTLYAVNPQSVASKFQDQFFNGISSFRVVTDAFGPTLAKIANVYINVNGLMYAMSNTQSTRYEYQSSEIIQVQQDSSVEKTGTLSIFVKAVDERGLESAWYGIDQKVRIYTPPMANISYHRCNADKSPNDAGTYCDLNCNLILDWLYTPYVPGEQQQTQNEFTISVDTTGYSVTEQFDNIYDVVSRFLIPNMDMERTYDINITIADLITSTSYTVRLSTAGVIMDFLRNGKGLALGKVAEHQGMVEVNPEWTFQSEKMKVRVKDGTDDKGMYDVGQLLCQILNRMNNGGL